MNIPKKYPEANIKEITASNYQNIITLLAFTLKLLVEIENKDERKTVQRQTIEYANRLLERYTK